MGEQASVGVSGVLAEFYESMISEICTTELIGAIPYHPKQSNKCFIDNSFIEISNRRAGLTLKVDQKDHKNVPKTLRVFKRSKSEISPNRRTRPFYLGNFQPRSRINCPPLNDHFINHVSKRHAKLKLPVFPMRKLRASEPGNWSLSQEFSVSPTCAIFPPQLIEVWPPSVPASPVRKKSGLQSPNLYHEPEDEKSYLDDLDQKMVKWVTQTDPIIEQWEIFARIHEETGVPNNSTWVMKRLNQIYQSQSLKSKPLINCKIYNRLQRIKDKFTTLDLLPGVEDSYFSSSEARYGSSC